MRPELMFHWDSFLEEVTTDLTLAYAPHLEELLGFPRTKISDANIEPYLQSHPILQKLQILLKIYGQILIEKSRIYRLKIFWKKFGKSEQKNVMKIYGLKPFSKFFFRKKVANLSIKNARIWLWKRAQIVSFWPFFSLFAFWLGNFSTNQAITYILFW